MNLGNIIFDSAAFKGDLLETLGAVMHQTIAQASGGDAFATAPQAALDFIKGRQNKLAETADAIHASVKEQIEAGGREGDTLNELTKRIESVFEGVGSGRAKTIARTETSAAFGFSQQDAMGRAGIAQKQWLCSGLPNVRPAHRAANGQTVALEEPFIVAGEELDYPGDDNGSPENVINCRCVSIAVDPGDAEELLPIGL